MGGGEAHAHLEQERHRAGGRDHQGFVIDGARRLRPSLGSARLTNCLDARTIPPQAQPAPTLRDRETRPSVAEYSACMRARAFAAVAAATAVAALSPAVGAAAGAKPANRHPKPAYKTLRASINESFRVRGTNGFLVEAKLRDRHELTLAALSAHGKRLSSTTYTLEAPQRHGSDEIKARLGKLGGIDVRFVVESTHHEKSFLPSCKGDRPAVAEGHSSARSASTARTATPTSTSTVLPAWSLPSRGCAATSRPSKPN